MTRRERLTIDPAERFPLLANAPIAEAVIEIRARAATEWKEDNLRAPLTGRLPDYPEFRMQREIHLGASFDAEGSTEQFHRAYWHGARLTSADKLHIAQFNRDGFAFSRLAPYRDWEEFSDEALRLWRIHAELAQPNEIERIGLRFINRISLPPEGAAISDFLRMPPQPPATLDLPVVNFVHQDTWDVFGYPYTLNLTQTIQPATPGGLSGNFLILDIDVGTTQPCAPTLDAIEPRLAEMRWLKNKAFFGSITDQVVQSLSPR
jgi:uncharacterized protein (TIGR04255 family)